MSLLPTGLGILGGSIVLARAGIASPTHGLAVSGAARAPHVVASPAQSAITTADIQCPIALLLKESVGQGYGPATAPVEPGGYPNGQALSSGSCNTKPALRPPAFAAAAGGNDASQLLASNR